MVRGASGRGREKRKTSSALPVVITIPAPQKLKATHMKTASVGVVRRGKAGKKEGRKRRI